MFLFKKIVAPLFYPLPLCTLLLALGVALLWFTRRQRTGKVLVTFSFALLVLLGYGVISQVMLRSLEQTYPPPAPEAFARAKWVVVLSGDTLSNPALPPGARAGGATRARVVEGVRLHRQIPGSRLVLSGAAAGPGSDTEVMMTLAVLFGVPADTLVIEGNSLDTESQAMHVGAMVKREPCLLVTSAYHMPRAMALFAKAGVEAVAAPAHFITDAARPIAPTDFYPSAIALVFLQIATNEHLGLAWARLRGRA